VTPQLTIIECCNFVDYPAGGQLSFARHLISSFGKHVKLIGLTTEKVELGKWTKKNIDGNDYDFFPYLYLPKESKKPLIPVRLRNFLALRKYKREIQRSALNNVILQSPDTVLAVMDFGFINTCYRFAGTENPLAISRYKFARSIAFLYDKFFLPKLSKISLLLAAADNKAIEELVIRSKGSLKKENIKQFITRVDTKIYNCLPKSSSRDTLQIPMDQQMIVTTGRLGWFKGWKFMIDSFKIFLLNHHEAHLYFIGNGEDYFKIKAYISELKLDTSIHLVGFKNADVIAQYLNAADLFIMGSYKEGWSTSLIEAITCGVPACVTNFSSAKDIIENGINGYVAVEHDEIKFVELMNKCLKIDRNSLPRNIDIEKYAIKNLKSDLLKLWPVDCEEKTA
jgi:glycosyltransferase involved in cell wall biosynthesis